MPVGARDWTSVRATLWFTALALLVVGPLLGPGYLLLLDFPSGPRLPQVELFPTPSSGEVGNATPLLGLHSLLRSVHTYLPDKVFLLAPLLAGGLGVYRFARRKLGIGALSATYGGTLFAVNPFVYDRYLSGHLHFLLGYSLLPWALEAVSDAMDNPSGRRAVPLAFWLFVLGVIDLHIAGMYALLVVLAALFSAGRARLRIGMVAGAVGLGVGFSSFWLLPALFVPPGQGIGPADLEVYASRPQGLAVLPSLTALHGFWRDEFTGAAERLPTLSVLVVPIIGLALVGAVFLLGPGSRRRLAAIMAVVVGLALLLAAGTSFPPTAGLFRWMFDHVPFFGIYREPQKFVALLVLAYAVFGAAGLHALLPRPSSGHVRRSLSGLGGAVPVAVAIAYAYTMLWGFWGQVHLSRYPDDWERAELAMASRGPGRLLVLPWHLYAVWSFSDGRIVASPASSFFSGVVLSAGEAGFETVPPQSADPFKLYIQSVLNHRNEVRWFGHLTAPLGIRYVVSLREVDFWKYRFLERQDDLAPMYRGKSLVLFENLDWREAPVGLELGDDVEGVSTLFGSGKEREVTDRLHESRPLRPRAGGAFPPIARALPIWRRLEPSNPPLLLTADRCTDGWRLGRQAARCHLGAVAAFESPERPEVLWRPLAGTRILGYLVSGLTLASAAVYLLRARRPSDESAHGT
jgi:hypothetical protein